MPWRQSDILEVFPSETIGTDLKLSWRATPLIGRVFQVYINRRLVYAGTATRCTVPVPTAGSRIDIGTVLSAEIRTNFASSLPAAPEPRITLKWQGGSFEGADLAGFRVYGESMPGTGIDYATILATIPAYPINKITDGYGLGPFGGGGFGQSASLYEWTSGPLTGGTWNWGVKPFDLAGNEGAAMTDSAFICVPPREVAIFADRTRLHYVVLQFGQTAFGSDGFGSPEVMLTWNPSPDA